jgi:hypothetical protein
MSDVSLVHSRGILLQGRQRFDEAMYRYRVAIQCRPRLAGEFQTFTTEDVCIHSQRPTLRQHLFNGHRGFIWRVTIGLNTGAFSNS